MSIEYKLQVFEGPLDLLLHLIEKNKVNIYDIPIVEITDQYLEYVNAMDKQDLNVVSEFLVMAATLIDIKSKMLLPKQEDENGEAEDPRQELVEKLLEYKMYKYMSFELKDRHHDAGRSVCKMPTVPDEVKEYEAPVNLEELLEGLTLTKLHEIFEDVIKRQEDKIDPVRSKFTAVEKEEVSLEDKINYIVVKAKEYKKFSFRKLLESQCSKIQIVVTFLAVLELMKVGQINIIQEKIFDDIVISYTG
ncbi:MAG: segregation/condensation protein A [Lachnospiraceae bacterium]|nr:segregation/condensation protein A [Lachnospiraceae bacterium]MBQ4068147.1 segregation/condensation protein A [Lachnospiraceae bacterium]